MVHVMKYLDARQPTRAQQDEHELEAALDLVQPGWRELVVQRRLLPRMQAVGALPLASTGGLAGRPGPHVAGFPTLFLAGDWIGPAGYLLDASLASGREAARLAGAGIDGLRAAA
jgi:hypothetical protein